MGEREQFDLWYQPHGKITWGKLEVEAVGGLVYGIGFSVVLEKTPFYYGLFALRLMLLCLFLDVSLYWNETPLEDA
jgi:hypothetical protein